MGAAHLYNKVGTRPAAGMISAISDSWAAGPLGRRMSNVFSHTRTSLDRGGGGEWGHCRRRSPTDRCVGLNSAELYW